MPNNITNVLKATGEENTVKAMFEAVKSDDIGLGSIDFNKIIPAPDYIYQGNLGQEEREKYGKNNWYDWNRLNWGTKWNSYGYSGDGIKDFDGKTITFETAWNSVPCIIKKLSEQYPDIEFEYSYSDEDFGYNVGAMKYKAGMQLSSYIPDGGTREAIELAAAVHATTPEKEGYFPNSETGEYEYRDEEEATHDQN